MASYLGREAWELGREDEPVRARLRFRFPASLLAARQGRGELETEHEDGSATRVFDVHQVHPFLRWVLSLQDDVVLLDPPELVRELRELAGNVAALYAGDAGHPADAGEDEDDNEDAPAGDVA